MSRHGQLGWRLRPGTLAAALGLLCLTAACREETPEAGGAAEDTRQETCRLLVVSATALGTQSEDLRRLVESAGGPEAARCLTENALDPTRCMAPAQAEVYRRTQAELVNTCLGWSDTLRSCLLRGDLDSPACARAYAEEEGLVVASPQREGPAARWSLALDEAVLALAPLPDGQLAALTARAVYAVVEGRRAWRFELPAEASGFLVPLAAGALLVGTRDGGLHFLDSLTGRPRLRVGLPEGAWPVEALRLGGRVLLLAADSRLFWAYPERCSGEAGGCLEPWTALGATPLHSVQPLRPGPQDLTLVTADERLTALEPTGRVTFQLEARQGLGAATPLPGDRVALVVDGRLTVLRPAMCRSRAPIRLGLPPQPKDQPPDLDVEHAPPPACVLLDFLVPLLSAFAPVPGDPEGRGLVVVAGSRLIRLDGRQERWKTEVNPVSQPLASPTGPLYVICLGRGLDQPAELRAVSPSTGLSLWRSELPFPTQALLEDHRPLLTLSGDQLLVGLGPHLAAYELNRTSAPSEPGSTAEAPP